MEEDQRSTPAAERLPAQAELQALQLQTLQAQHPGLTPQQVQDLARDIALFRRYAEAVAAVPLHNGEAPFSPLFAAPQRARRERP